MFRVGPNDVVRLPWHHRVEYQADRQNPFFIGTSHIVPMHSEGVPVVPRVAHLVGDPLLADPYRHGDPREFQPSMANFTNGPAHRIAELSRFAVERFSAATFSEHFYRNLGALILEENYSWGEADENAQVPASLDEMMSYVRNNLGGDLSVKRLSSVCDISPTSAQRLFNTHLGTSVAGWVRQMRLQEAAHLLRTSGFRVNEISRLVGFQDPLYFSRVFSAKFGVPPSSFAHGELRP